MKLEPPNTLHLRAALGWLELGNHLEANEELEKITPTLRAHPHVLDVRWRIYAAAKQWEPCVDLARALTKLVPDELVGWIHLAFTLHALKRTKEAWETLLPVADKFAGEWLVSYNLACYAATLGDLKSAWNRLERAFEIGDADKIKLKALGDPDLEPLWAQIGEI